jgi:large subunit ribosomal protein L11
LKIQKGSGNPKEEKVGDLSIQEVIDLAKKKRTQVLARSLKLAVKEILGSCVSMGVTVEGKDPREIQKTIDSGDYDSLFEQDR